MLSRLAACHRAFRALPFVPTITSMLPFDRTQYGEILGVTLDIDTKQEHVQGVALYEPPRSAEIVRRRGRQQRRHTMNATQRSTLALIAGVAMALRAWR